MILNVIFWAAVALYAAYAADQAVNAVALEAALTAAPDAA